MGEIQLDPWRCVAELIDNSIDGFLESANAGYPIPHPTVTVGIGGEAVKVIDNGPGMSLQELENAVRAGWTSRDKIGSLGLYGIGFNIATARLGWATTIWTSRAGDPLDYGLQIDLKRMQRGTTYQLQPRTRIKSITATSGTEVEITGVKPDWREKFLNGGWVRTHVTERLSRVYGSMLRANNPQPVGIALIFNNRRVRGWEHCVWPAERTVYRKAETLVRPIQEIDETFGTKYYSPSKDEYFDSRDDLDPHDVVEVPQRVYGWIGIQRYLDEKDFGVDILRNGRKIEIGCKDIFEWDDGAGGVKEYPIDDPRFRGRIVGEIHLDHGYVHYTKHRFERDHASWKQLLRALRHDEPLTNRSRYGYAGVNTSKLGVLFRTFRRSSPPPGQAWKDYLLLKDNEVAKEWAEKWRKGDQALHDDDLWFRRLDEYGVQERDKTGAAPPPQPDDPPDQTQDEPDPLDPDAGSTAAVPDDQPSPPASSQRKLLPNLTMHVTGVGVSGHAYDVETYLTEPAPDAPSHAPWRAQATARGVYEIDANPEHPFFSSMSWQLRDAVLSQIAHYITVEEQASAVRPGEVTYADILAALRKQYATTDSIDAAQLATDIEGLRKDITSRLASKLDESAQAAVLDKLPQDDVSSVQLAHARGDTNAPFVSYLELRHVALLLESQPEPIFTARCFDRPWTPPTLADKQKLLDDYRARLATEIRVPLEALANFRHPVGDRDAARAYFAFIRACANLLRSFMPASNA